MTDYSAESCLPIGLPAMTAPAPDLDCEGLRPAVATRLLVHDYGGFAFPLELSRELARRGHHVVHAYVSFLSTPRVDFAKGPDDPPNLEIQLIPMNPAYGRNKYSFPRRFFMNLGYAVRLLKFVLKSRPRLVLSGNAPSEVQLPLCMLCRVRGFAFVNWVQDFFSIAVTRHITGKWWGAGSMIGLIYGAADRWVVERSRNSILISDHFVRVLDHWNQSHAPQSVIPNWASVEKLPAGSRDNAWAARHGLAGRFVFLYSGTLGLKHNPSLFLDLAKRFEPHKDVDVVVISEGAGADWLADKAQALNRKNLRVMPFQAASELPDVLASADVLTAVLEKDAGQFSVPSKVLTYFCAQRAILLAVPVDNLASRIVLDNQMGLVSEPGDTEGFIENAFRLYADGHLRDEMGARARRYAEDNFDIGTVADKFEHALGISSPVPAERAG